jgi:hypothetical protein
MRRRSRRKFTSASDSEERHPEVILRLQEVEERARKGSGIDTYTVILRPRLDQCEPLAEAEVKTGEDPGTERHLDLAMDVRISVVSTPTWFEHE